MNPGAGEFADSLKAIMPLGRYGHTGDVAAVVSFPAGPAAGYVTGANCNVDGGFTVQAPLSFSVRKATTRLRAS